VEIQIESPQFPLKASLNRYLRRRLREDLAFCSGRIREVRAYLSDTRTGHGGIDKQCRLVVRFSREGEVSAQSVEIDLFVAIRCAADRLNRAVARRIRHQTEALEQQSLRAAGAAGWLKTA
jgi:hypothetical protein